MFRINTLTEIPDSDNSISDDDDETNHARAWPENFVSLAETSDHKKESIGVASQLELLKGVHQNDVGFSSDDEVEAPEFLDIKEAPEFDEKRILDSPGRTASHSICLKRNGSTCKVDEQLSSDKYKERRMLFDSIIAGNTVSETLDRYDRGKQKHSEQCTWSALDKHPMGAVDRYPSVGGRPATKTRSSSHCQQHKTGNFWPSVQKYDFNSTSDDDFLDEPEPEPEAETLDYQQMDKSFSEALACYDAKQISESNVASLVEADIQHDRSRYSMVELLDGLQGKNKNLHLKCKMVGRKKGRTGKHTVIRSASSSGKDIMSDEDPTEVMNSGSSTDNEEKAQNTEIANVESKRRTMADIFQEAFGSSVDRRPSFAVLNQSSNGLLGRLQLVLLRQKERDMEFFKNQQTDVWPKGESRCLDVKIMSRSYDAKLIVCQCSLLENEESSLENPQCENFGKVWTVIFSPRVCGDVDLEVANLVRIHPSWKEVKVLVGGEIIIMATYYSQIHT